MVDNNMAYERWAFETIRHDSEQSEQWWQHCFVPTPAIRQFAQTEGSAIIMAPPGSGKSTAIDYARRQLSKENKTFIIDYPVRHWPGGQRPYLPDKRHMPQIMAVAAAAMNQYLSSSPDEFARINPFQQEFLFWLLDRFLQRRAVDRLAYRIKHQTELQVEVPNPIPQLYDSDLETANAWGQIDELVDLAQALGFKQLALLIDLSEWDLHQHNDALWRLMGQVGLMEHANFCMRIALPDAVPKPTIMRAGGRLNPIRLEYNEAVRNDIISRHLSLATGGKIERLAQIAQHSIVERGAKEIKKLYEHQSIRGWLLWSETVLYLYTSQEESTEPVTQKLENVEEIVYQFYYRHIPLRLVPDQQKVMMGAKIIQINDQPYEVLRELFDLRQRLAPERLITIAGSSKNLNTIISRLRKQLEPLPNRHIYLHSQRNQGYWLENYI